MTDFVPPKAELLSLTWLF